jgi:hypothetical protein
MPIIIAAAHLPVAKAQCYQLYDLINSYLLTEPPGKSTFLNQMAQCYRYQSWDHFRRETRGHQTCKNTLIFSPENIEVLAASLKEQLGNPFLSHGFFVACLHRCLSSAERAFFSPGSQPAFPLRPIELTLDMGPNGARRDLEKASLLYWWKHASQGSAAQLTDSYLSYAKIVHHEEAGKQNENCHISLVSSLHQQGFLNVSEDVFTLSERAEQWCQSYVTQDFGREWQLWWARFLKAFSTIPHKRLETDWRMYMNFFHHGKSAEEAAQSFSWSGLETQAANTIGSLVEATAFPQGDRVLHFHPTLRLSTSDAKLRANRCTLTMHSPDLDLSGVAYKLNKPFPNKGYIGASAKKQASPFHGFLISIPEALKKVTIIFTWGIPSKAREYTITHTLTLILPEGDSKANHLCSPTIETHHRNVAPSQLQTSAFYNFRDYFQPKEGESFSAAGCRHERIQTQLETAMGDGNGNITLLEHLTLADRPYFDGFPLFM